MASTGTGVSELATRYSTALYELADEGKILDQVATDLSGLRTLLAESDDLRRLVGSPVVSRADQGRAMAAVLERAGVSDLTRKFVGLLAANRRLFALGAFIDAFLAELGRRRGETRARVTAARPLSDAQVRSIEDALKRSTGVAVSVDVSVDPALLGGIIVRHGSRMIDGSVRAKLNKLQIAMKASGGLV